MSINVTIVSVKEHLVDNRKRNRLIGIGLLIAVTLLVLLTSLMPSHALAPAPQTSVAPVVSVSQASSPGAQQSTKVLGVSSQKARAITATPQCSPATQLLIPNAPALSSEQNGLRISATTKNSYVVYGQNVAEISAQLFRCSPVRSSDGTFAGSTDYNMNWSYNFTANELGLCVVNHVSVGLNVNQTMPEWQNTQNSTPATIRVWETFLKNLQTHEDGHVVIDKQYAAQLLHELSNVSPESCETISSTVQEIIHKNVDALEEANKQYDAQTNHGVTQGAVLR